MAIDSKPKRFSMMAFSDGALLPDPDASIGTTDRAHLLWLYIGIALGEAPEVVEITGLDKPDRKPYEYQKQILDLPPAERRADPVFAMRQEQRSVMEANKVAEQLTRQNEEAAAERVSQMLATEKANKDRADRRRAASLTNLAKAQLAKEAKAERQAEINKTNRKNLQKARRKLKRQRAKKK